MQKYLTREERCRDINHESGLVKITALVNRFPIWVIVTEGFCGKKSVVFED